MTFDDAIALDRRGPGSFVCEVSSDYWLAAGPNGGYIAALLAHAGDVHLGEEVRQLRGLTVHYLRRPEPGHSVIEVTTEQLGRSVAFQRVSLLQQGRPVALASGTWANARTGVEYHAAERPDAPDPGSCQPMAAVREGGHFPVHQQWDIRSADGRVLGSGPPATLAWWIRPPVHRRLDGPMLVAMADALPPPLFMVGSPEHGVPTLDLTVHIRAQLGDLPWQTGDWILARFQSRVAVDGYVEEDGELWTEHGTLVAQSRQLAMG